MRLTKPLFVSGLLLAVAFAFGIVLIVVVPREPDVAKAAGRTLGDPVPFGAARPGEVLLIRHGEEPKNGPDLDDRGRARANALVGLFQHPLTMPTSIFAASSSKQSQRPVQTCEPLAKAINVPVDSRFDENEFRQLATAILQGTSKPGGIVLVCWKRETMSQLAAALGVANPPAEWPSHQYDHIWRISYTPDNRAKLSDEPMGIKLDGSGQ